MQASNLMNFTYCVCTPCVPQISNASMARAKCYHTMDAFVKLVVVLVRYSGDTSNTVTKVNLLNKVSVIFYMQAMSFYMYIY